MMRLMALMLIPLDKDGHQGHGEEQKVMEHKEGNDTGNELSQTTTTITMAATILIHKTLALRSHFPPTEVKI